MPWQLCCFKMLCLYVTYISISTMNCLVVTIYFTFYYKSAVISSRTSYNLIWDHRAFVFKTNQKQPLMSYLFTVFLKAAQYCICGTSWDQYSMLCEPTNGKIQNIWELTMLTQLILITSITTNYLINLDV